jgi:hypothetical protein
MRVFLCVLRLHPALTSAHARVQGVIFVCERLLRMHQISLYVRTYTRMRFVPDIPGDHQVLAHEPRGDAR